MIFIDIETIPDQTQGAVEQIAESLEVKAPSTHNKPDFIKDLNLGDSAKYKTVSELKQMWVEEFAESKRIEQAKEQWLKTSFDGGKGNLCCVGITDDDKSITTLTGDEVTILESLNIYLRQYSTVTFVAHNKRFDLSFLFKRMVINGVKPEFVFDPHSKKHICTMELWEGFGGKISLDKLANQLDLGGKIDGMFGS